MAVDLVTFGCRLNAYESEVMRRNAAAAGLDAASGKTVIVNTCAVTAEAVRQARQTIRRLRREAPQARIVVTGCAGDGNWGWGRSWLSTAHRRMRFRIFYIRGCFSWERVQ